MPLKEENFEHSPALKEGSKGSEIGKGQKTSSWIGGITIKRGEKTNSGWCLLGGWEVKIPSRV